MSSFKPLGPLDFDYERFPGVALRATDQALKGHELTDRPEQILLLAERIAKLAGHILILTGRSALCTSANRAAVQDQLEALQVAVNALQHYLQAFSGSPQSLSALEVREVTAAAGAGFSGVVNLLLLLLDKWKSPTSLESYRQLFDKRTIPPPQAVNDFLDRPDRNRVFASWWVQGNNPLCVSRVTLDDIECAVGTLHPDKYLRVMPGDTPRNADRDGRLFWVDFPTLLAGLKRGDFPVRKRLPKPYVLFAVKPGSPNNEPFVPLAIFDDSIGPKGGLVWSDVASPGTANAWTRAMLASLCANQLHHTFVSHFPRTHFVMEAVAVATLRELAPDHPLFWLLRTHIDGTLSFNKTALDSFTTQSGADRFLMACSLRTGQALMVESLNGWKAFHFDDDIVKQRRVDGLPYYPYRDDAQRWWTAIGNFVCGVVNAGYATDADVRNDTPLQKWADVLVRERTSDKQGAELIPAAPRNKAELAALLQKILFTCTAYHAAVQVPLNGFDVSPLTAPGSLYPDSLTDPPHSMLASLGTALFQLAFFYFGDVITHLVGTYAVAPPANMQAPVDGLKAAIQGIKGSIDNANATTRKDIGAYTPLLPEKVSRSVDI